MSVPLTRVLFSVQRLTRHIPQGEVEFAWQWRGELSGLGLAENSVQRDWFLAPEQAHSLHTILYRSAHELLRAQVEGSFAVTGTTIERWRPARGPEGAWEPKPYLWLHYTYDLYYRGASAKPRTENPQRLLEWHLARLGGLQWRGLGKLHFLMPLARYQQKRRSP